MVNRGAESAPGAACYRCGQPGSALSRAAAAGAGGTVPRDGADDMERWRLMPATVKPGTAQDKITFKTNNPKHAEVNIPLMIRPAPTPPVAGATPAKFSPTVTPMATPADGTLPPQLSATASPVAAQPISATADEQTPAKDAAAAPKQPGANP